MSKKKPKEKPIDKAVYRRLIGYAKPYKGRLILGAIFGVIFGTSFAGILAGIQKVFEDFFGPVELSADQMLTTAAFLPVFALVWAIGSFFSKYFMFWVGLKVVMDLRTKTYNHIQDLSVAYFSQSHTGELITRTTNDTSLVERGVSNALADIVREPCTLISAIAFMFFRLDHSMVLVSLIVFPICVIPITLFGKRVRRMSREGQAFLGTLVSRIHETITGIRIVKSFCMEEAEKKRFYDVARKVFRRNLGVVVARTGLEAIIVLLACIGLTLVFVYAASSGKGFGELMTFALALFVMYQPVKKLSNLNVVIQQSAAAAERIFEILDTPIDVQDEVDAVALEGSAKDIVFRDVCFSYEEGKSTLKHINLTIRQGEFVAFVGPSGGGKSTLLNLLPRFYDADSGTVEINGRDVRHYTLQSLRKEIGIVTQDTILFNTTIAENITYGSGDQSPEEMERVARQAHAHRFIVEQTNGYDEEIGEMGSRLSGGQRQRLAIARALMKQPSILMMDEATSALDAESEEQIQVALEEIRQDHTVLVIAHRLSTIQGADRIVVIEAGEIVEQGAHEELLAQKGTYHKLYEI